MTAVPARALVALKVPPDLLTLLGLFGTGASCAYYLVANNNTWLFCGLVLACGLCDVLDGAVARLSGRASRWGSYLDAMADRYAEAMVALTVAWVTQYWLLISLVLAGSLLISYAKARASMEVVVTNLEWPDLMERAERGLIFLGGLALSAKYPRTWHGHDVFWWMLVGLAVAIHLTVLQRMWRAWRFIIARGIS